MSPEQHREVEQELSKRIHKAVKQLELAAIAARSISYNEVADLCEQTSDALTWEHGWTERGIIL